MPVKTAHFPIAVSEEDFEIIENALRQLPGVRHVDMQRATKEVTIEWEDPTSWRDIERAVSDLGYVPASEP